MVFRMIQLYTKSFDGTYNKVNWNNLKVKPDVQIKRAINKIPCKSRVLFREKGTIILKEDLLRELGLEK